MSLDTFQTLFLLLFSPILMAGPLGHLYVILPCTSCHDTGKVGTVGGRHSWKPFLYMAMTYLRMMVTVDCTDTLLSTKPNVLSAHLSCSWIPQIPSLVSILPDTGASRKQGWEEQSLGWLRTSLVLSISHVRLRTQCRGALLKPLEETSAVRSPEVQLHCFHGKNASEWGPVMTEFEHRAEEAGLEAAFL